MKHEVNDIKPTSLSHIVGQRGVVEQVKVALDASFQDGKRMDHCLMVGPPGLGKSALANIVAQEMATEFHEVLGQSIVAPSDLNSLLLVAKDKSIIHIDEVHELKKEFQTCLYLALDQRKLLLPGGKNIQSLPLNDFTLLLSTTDEYSLLQPLRHRMRLVLRFELYSAEELTTVLKHRTKFLGWDVELEVFPLIAQRARGTPRLACHAPL